MEVGKRDMEAMEFGKQSGCQASGRAVGSKDGRVTFRGFCVALSAAVFERRGGKQNLTQGRRGGSDEKSAAHAPRDLRPALCGSAALREPLPLHFPFREEAKGVVKPENGF